MIFLTLPLTSTIILDKFSFSILTSLNPRFSSVKWEYKQYFS